jgi:hypothetical protein
VKHLWISDRCDVNNGDCDSNAVCSHDEKSFEVKCVCKRGFVNVGVGGQVICRGKFERTVPLRVFTCMCERSLCWNRVFVDACDVRNGGCDRNAKCSHVDVTNEVKCTCKVGFVNVGSSESVVCKGWCVECFETVQIRRVHSVNSSMVIDACEFNNGGCDANAQCSHDAQTNAVQCTCKTGFTNTGCSAKVVCTGMFDVR